MISAGIDAGSRSIKVVLLDLDTHQVLACGQTNQGVHQEALAQDLFLHLLEQTGVDQSNLRGIIATGYGRNLIGFADTTVTEITCHARGVCHTVPSARTIVEIGGQDSKCIRLNGDGTVRDFAMNDRCAAGTGRFLEVVAARLGVTLDALGALAKHAKSPAHISSTCVVFAETEIIGLLASGAAPADIVAGVLIAVSTRVGAMAGRHVEDPVLFTGGVALIPGMVDCLKETLGHPVCVAPEPQFTGALGAALTSASP
ncbi:MAG: 2-hydroxyglutaryl-CoA dehydratase [Candidatus Hydrogenedentes bacterium]|nr:2-hydroxyglutaryl-CoA dehydratase [Candidatus Hydrogenedentota bacterium]